MEYSFFNPNPHSRSVGDCTVRALAKALNQTWEATYAGLALEGFIQGDLPNADTVWMKYLKERGFKRYWLPDECPDCYTVELFAEDHPEGTFVVSMPGNHVVTVADGVIYDSWNSGREVPTYYFEKER